MTMNPRVAMAFSAMKEIGFAEKKVKPVLKNLLRVYEKNWELIEDENYRVLADAILDYQEEHKEDVEKQKRKKKEVVEPHEDPEPPRLKRLRQDDQSPPPLVRRQMGPNFDLTPRVEGIESFGHRAVPLNVCMPGRDEALMSLPYEVCARDETEEPPAQLQLRRKRSEHAQPVSPNINFEDRGRGSLLAPTICKRSEREMPTAPFVVCLKEPKTEPGIEPLPPKDKLASGDQTKVLVKPKTEPSNDGFQPSGTPAAVTHPLNPDCRRTQGHKNQNVSNRRDSVEALPSRDAVENRSTGISSKNRGLDGRHSVEVLPSLNADVENRSLVGSGTSSKNKGPELADGRHSVEASPSRDTYEENGSLGVSGTASKNRGLEIADVAEATRASVELASSNSGEVKISLTCNYSSGKPNFRIPSMDEVFKMVEDKCLNSYKVIDPNFSLKNLMKEMCQCISDSASDSTDNNQETLMRITPNLDLQKGSNMSSVSSYSSIEVIEPHTPQQLAMDGTDYFQVNLIKPNEEVLAGGANERDMIVEQAGVRSSSPSGVVSIRQEIFTPDDIRSVDDTLVLVRPSHDVNDISKGQESLPISTVNEVSSAPYPPLFYYISKNTIFRSAHVNCSLSRIGDEDCCINCFGDCVSSSIPCACARVTGGDFAYTLDGLLKENFLEECISVNRDPQNHLFYCKSCPLERCKDGDMPGPCKGHLMRKFIKECWSKCGCNKQCGNRVVQRGISHNLQVFLTAEGKGWGLRTLTDLPRGSFVCEYVGEILTSKELYERNKEITDVDVQTSNVLLDAAWGSDGVVKDKDALCLDATFYGNVARFINHRCFDANLVEVPVEVESPNHRYYHLAFFTTRDVEALEELTWDYGIDFSNRSDSVRGFRCCCRSKDCRDVKRQYI